MIYTCMIVDDEPLSHQVLRTYIDRMDVLKFNISFYNAPDARKYLEQADIDLLFLDIQMPEVTGIEFLKTLAHKPVTIFTTAYRNYALDAFDLGVVDYLLKPISFERFEQAIHRALVALNAREKERHFEIEIKTGHQTVLLDYRDIEYAKGLKDYTILYTRERKYIVLGSLKNYEVLLPKKWFLRVHKSYLVAKHIIRSIQQQKIIWGQTTIPIGRSHKVIVMEYIKKKTNAD